MTDARTAPVERVILSFPIPLRHLDKNHKPAHWSVRSTTWNRAIKDAHNEIITQLQVPGMRDWEPIGAPVRVRCRWRHQQGQQRPDYDNAIARLSPIFDALETAEVLDDDHQIEHVDVVFEPVPAGDEGLEIEIEAIVRGR